MSGGYSTAHGTPRERASRDRGAEGGRELTFAIAVSHCDDEVGLTVVLADGRWVRGILASEKGDVTRKVVCDWDVRGDRR